ncbi:3'-5' exonuclease [Bradyrhizobium sp. URHC0002]
MKHDRIMCLDIETVPDRTLVQIGGKMEKNFYPSLSGIGSLRSPSWRRIEYDKGLTVKYAVDCCRSGGDADWDEQLLLSTFWEYFAEHSPRVITWNGKGFDLPVLRARAMIYGISAHSWYK